MVDYQERDTRRGMEALGASSDDDPDDPDADDRPETEADHGSHEGHSGHHRDEHGEHGEHAHGHHAHDVETVRAAVVTVSSSRSLDDDPAGDAIEAAFEADDDEIVTRELIRDDYDGIQHTVDTLVGRDDVDLVVTTGGTGVSSDDVTPEAVAPLFEKDLPGFGELFRQRSATEIGTRVVGTRATAGIADGVPVFCLPGSESAARLGAAEIVVPEAGHLVGLARRDEHEESG